MFSTNGSATARKFAPRGDYSEIMPTPYGLRVLVVDDEPLIRWSIAEILNQKGHTVVEASSANGARAVIKDPQQEIDVVLLDYNLPDSNDLTLLEEVRKRRPHSAVILMTSYGTPELAKSALKLGAHRVIGKPFDMSDVETLVRNAYQARLH
jgi:DNA-binding NtrC family response regulator